MATVVQDGILKIPNFVCCQTREQFYYLESNNLSPCTIHDSVTNKDIMERDNWYLLSAGCLVLWSKDK